MEHLQLPSPGIFPKKIRQTKERTMKTLLASALVLASMLGIACFQSAYGAELLPNNRHIFISAANDGGIKYNFDYLAYGTSSNTGQYYIRADGGGLNSMHITTDPAIPLGQVTSLDTASSSPSGTFYITDTGGRGFTDNIILLLSVKGPINDNFSVTITSNGYTWTPNPVANAAPTGISYVTNALNESFTSTDFIYGPHVAKPGPGGDGITPNWSLPLYYGQNISDPDTAEYLMFIDLRAGTLISSTPHVTNPIDNGSIRVDYSFNNLYANASFNLYGWMLNSNQGEGINWANATSGTGASGYTINYTGPPPPTNYTLSVNFAENGSGTVYSTSPSSPSINCVKGSSDGCSATYASGTSVTLVALPDWKSLFTNWSGDYTSNSNPVTFTMDSNMTVDANLAPNYMTMLLPSATPYATIQDAIDNAISGGSIQAQATTFQEDLVFGRNSNITVKLTGGYDATYTSDAGMTVVQGQVEIRNGSVTIQNITIR